MRSLRILVVGVVYREAAIRGANVAIHGLARALCDRGHDVTLLQGAPPEHRVEIDGVRTLYSGSTRKSVFPLLPALRRLGEYDVIHAHEYAGAYLALRSRARPLPLVVQFHAPRVKEESFLRAGWRWRYTGLAVRYARSRLTSTRWLAEALATRYALDPADFRQVPLGVGEAWFDTPRPESRGGPLRVVVVNMKGLDTALAALARADLPPDARVELYGVDKSEDEHRALAERLGLGARISFRGFVPNTELPSRVAGAHLLLHATRSESFGQVLAEAAVLGIPALTSRVNAIPEVVEDGVTGLLCPVDDVAAFAEALGKLAGDRALRERLGAAARQRALERWRWPSVVERLEGEVYAPLKSLAASRAAGR